MTTRQKRDCARKRRKRIHNVLRRIAARHRDGRVGVLDPELAIRRVTEEVFDDPLPFED